MTATSDPYARQRLLDWWDQKRLGDAQVLVAGAGALGNELLKNLALMGVGHLLVIDFDRVEASNLSRCALFSADDVGDPKVEAAARGIARLNRDVEVRMIDGDLFYDVGLGWYRHCHLAVGCLDNLAGRSQVGLASTLAGIPYFDGGMWALGGEVRTFLSGDGPCFDCTLNREDFERANERRSCSGFRDQSGDGDGPVATLASTAAIVGGLLAQEVVKYLCRQEVDGGRALVYNGMGPSLHRAELVRNPACPTSHVASDEVVEVSSSAAELTAAELLRRARKDLGQQAGRLTLELDRDFLVRLHCPSCGRAEDIGQPQGRVLESAVACSHCGAVRIPNVLRALDENSLQAADSLAHLGVPDGEVLALRTATGSLCLYQLSGGLWPPAP